jgi:hypothetical protein
MAKAQPEAPPDPTTRIASLPESPQGTGSASMPGAVSTRTGRKTSVDRTGGIWFGLAIAGWLAGIAGLLGALLIGYVRFVASLRTRPPDASAWAEEWSSLLSGFSARGSSLATRVRRLLQPRPASEPISTRLSHT